MTFRHPFGNCAYYSASNAFCKPERQKFLNIVGKSPKAWKSFSDYSIITCQNGLFRFSSDIFAASACNSHKVCYIKYNDRKDDKKSSDETFGDWNHQEERTTMAKRLFDLVEIAENNSECVVLKVNENAFMDLVCLGCFDGDETMFRVTKDREDIHTITVWHGTRAISWETGVERCTLEAKSAKARELIVDCVVGDFGICIEGDGIAATASIASKENRLKKAVFKEMWWNGEKSRCVHFNGNFMRHFASHEAFMKWLVEKGWEIVESHCGGVAKTGCFLNEFVCKR